MNYINVKIHMKIKLVLDFLMCVTEMCINKFLIYLSTIYNYSRNKCFCVFGSICFGN